MPVHEVCGGMNGWRHVHVDDYKIIVARLCARVLTGRKLGWSLYNTIYGCCICLPLLFSEVAAIMC